MRQLEGGNIRASDDDRNTVAAELRIHCLEGRITVEELEQRLEKAIAAVTIHDLAEVTYDLPRIAVPSAAPTRRPTRIGPPGIRPFTQRVVIPATRERTRAVALETIAPALNGYSFELMRQSPIRLEFERSRRPPWTIAVAFFLFPFGLLALQVRNTERVAISLEEHGANQTAMIIHGSASRHIRKAFAELTFRA